MVVPFLVVWLSLGQLWSQAPAGAQSSTPPQAPASAGSERRVFSMRSAPAWDAVQKRLKELGFSIDKTDRTNHVILTKWRSVNPQKDAWMSGISLPSPYYARSIRFVVFVSPFAEPARVSIGSILEARNRATQVDGTAYNSSSANLALMNEISKALGEDGWRLPTDNDARRKMILSILKDDADECVRRESVPEGATFTPPRKIPLSDFQPIYPPNALTTHKEGVVRMELDLYEDGTVGPPRLVGPPPGDQLETSALGAASLLLYIPTSGAGCRVPTILTYSVSYVVG